jgi:hypothetical protein
MQANKLDSPAYWSRYTSTLWCCVFSAMLPASHLFRSVITGIVALTIAGPGMCSHFLATDCLAGQTAGVKKSCCCGQNCDCGPACSGDTQNSSSQPLPATPTRDVRDLASVSASHSTFAIEIGVDAFSPSVDSLDSFLGAGRKTLFALHTLCRV